VEDGVIVLDIGAVWNVGDVPDELAEHGLFLISK